MMMLPRFEEKNNIDSVVFKLKKSLYGLRQSLGVLFPGSSTTLTKLGYDHGHAYYTLFIKANE